MGIFMFFFEKGGVMALAERVKTFLELQGVNYQLVSHPRSLSSKQTAAAAHVQEDHIAKAVVYEDEEGLLMVVLPGDQWVKVKSLERELNRALTQVEENRLKDLFPDCVIGAIPPLGNVYGMETVVDEVLNSLANIYFEAGDHEHLVLVKGEDFRRLVSGARHGHFSHA